MEEELSQLRRMRLVSLLEGATLLILVFVAVPLRHAGGYRVATMIMGPAHGMAFLLYVWMLIQTVAAVSLPRRDVAWMIAAAFVPFGAFLNERMLRKVQATLAASA
jgi:integral membrane protein